MSQNYPIDVWGIERADGLLHSYPDGTPFAWMHRDRVTPQLEAGERPVPLRIVRRDEPMRTYAEPVLPNPAAVIAEGIRLTQDYYANPTCNVRRHDAEHWLVMHGAALLAVAEAAEEVWQSVPGTWDDDDPMVVRHARALNTLADRLRRLAPTTDKETP